MKMFGSFVRQSIQLAGGRAGFCSSPLVNHRSECFLGLPQNVRMAKEEQPLYKEVINAARIDEKCAMLMSSSTTTQFSVCIPAQSPCRRRRPAERPHRQRAASPSSSSGLPRSSPLAAARSSSSASRHTAHSGFGDGVAGDRQPRYAEDRVAVCTRCRSRRRRTIPTRSVIGDGRREEGDRQVRLWVPPACDGEWRRPTRRIQWRCPGVKTTCRRLQKIEIPKVDLPDYCRTLPRQ